MYVPGQDRIELHSSSPKNAAPGGAVHRYGGNVVFRPVFIGSDACSAMQCMVRFPETISFLIVFFLDRVISPYFIKKWSNQV
jgi:hypothetical protein